MFTPIPALQLIPQRAPFVLVDTLVDCEDHTALTRYTVRAGSAFCPNGTLLEAGLVENVAQSCAARIGYLNSFLTHQAVQLGIIGSIRNFDVFFLPPVGSTLETTITVESEVFSMTLINARVECQGRVAATCEMKIALTDIAMELN